MNTSQELRSFIERLGSAVRSDRPEAETVAEIKSVVTSALERKGWLPERCLTPAGDCYARHLLHRDPDGRFVVVAMVWQPSQATMIHDHGGVWCVEGVYQGRVRVTRFDLEGPVRDDVARFHPHEEIVAGVGMTGALIPPVDHHRIDNPFETVAVTVHTYGCDLRSCNVYLPRADGSYEVRRKDLGYTTLPEARISPSPPAH